MEKMIDLIDKLRNSEIRNVIDKRLSEFDSFRSKSNKDWFAELCFCILTANSKARTALMIEKELGKKGFCELCEKDVKECIRRNKHRFHNNKARYIVEARKNMNIKKVISEIVNKNGEKEAREWLVRNVKGLGYKEASHFLRNIGYKNLAILDRHILNLMKENDIINEKPKSLNKKNYFEIEEKFSEIAKKAGMSNAELDLYLWYMKTGEVLK